MWPTAAKMVNTVHILVMNDTQEILELFTEILTEEGYQVTTYSYSTQELDIVRQVRPDLIIADFPPVVREEHGWQFVQKLKMSRDTAHIPLIICTTNIRAVRDTEGWLAAKGVLIVPKPFEIDELLQAVKTQLGKANTPPPQPPDKRMTDASERPSDQ
jgi:DNA-binding response OmpR family regulator